jgi:hypothetical protein
MTDEAQAFAASVAKVVAGVDASSDVLGALDEIGLADVELGASGGLLVAALACQAVARQRIIPLPEVIVQRHVLDLANSSATVMAIGESLDGSPSVVVQKTVSGEEKPTSLLTHDRRGVWHVDEWHGLWSPTAWGIEGWPAAGIAADGLRSTAGILTDQTAVGMLQILRAAELSGLARRALDMTIQHTTARVAFGEPLVTKQVVRHRIVEAELSVYGAELFVGRAAAITTGDARFSAWAAAALAEAMTSAFEICETALQLHGAMGFTEEVPLGAIWRRVLMLHTTGSSLDDHLESIASDVEARGPLR